MQARRAQEAAAKAETARGIAVQHRVQAEAARVKAEQAQTAQANAIFAEKQRADLLRAQLIRTAQLQLHRSWYFQINENMFLQSFFITIAIWG